MSLPGRGGLGEGAPPAPRIVDPHSKQHVKAAPAERSGPVEEPHRHGRKPRLPRRPAPHRSPRSRPRRRPGRSAPPPGAHRRGRGHPPRVTRGHPFRRGDGGRGRDRLDEAPVEDGDLADAWYTLIATSDRQANTEHLPAEAERHRVWCVRSDDADAATAWTPATGHSEGVTVAVLTTNAKGRDPRHTAAIRDAVVEGLRDGTLVAPHHRTRTPGVALVGGGPGDPDLITVRGRRLLAEADVVIADRLGPRDLLAELPPHVEVIDAAKIPYGRYMAQEGINNALIEHAKQGKSVVRLKGGDPFVFGRGMEEAQALAEAGIACTVVPGISSSISVPGAAGIPVTHRGVAHEFTVVSGHVAPDDEQSLVDWAALARLRGTLVVLVGVDRSAGSRRP